MHSRIGVITRPGVMTLLDVNAYIQVRASDLAEYLLNDSSVSMYTCDRYHLFRFRKSHLFHISMLALMLRVVGHTLQPSLFTKQAWPLGAL